MVAAASSRIITRCCQRCLGLCKLKTITKFVAMGFGAVIGLPLEHWVWEHTPYAMQLLDLIGVTV